MNDDELAAIEERLAAFARAFNDTSKDEREWGDPVAVAAIDCTDDVGPLVAALAEARAENERLRAEAQDCCTCEQPTHSVDTFCWACKLSDLEEAGDGLRAALAEAHRTLADVEAVIVTELLSGPIGVADAEWGGKPVRLHPDEVREVAANVAAALAASRSGAAETAPAPKVEWCEHGEREGHRVSCNTICDAAAGGSCFTPWCRCRCHRESQCSGPSGAESAGEQR